MARLANREAVACASGLNWCAFILMLFATISSYWTWGYAYPPAGSPSIAAVTVSTGPWVAAQAWSTYPIPCGCSGGVCWQWCYVGTAAVMWGSIPAEAACGPNSIVYKNWAGPLGYCSFPGGTAPPTQAPTPLPNGAKAFNTYGDVPEGTTFNNPSQPASLQALTIISTITVFFAAVAGCADAGAEGVSNKGIAASAAFCSLIAWVFCLAAYCLWTTFPYITSIQTENPSVWMPVWINQTANQMGAIEVYDTWLGPGWATALTSSILIFFANVIHCMSLGDRKADYEEDAKWNAPAQPIPAAAAPVPAAAVPTTAVPVGQPSVGTNIATV